MGDGNERGRSRGIENLSLEAYPRDLLQIFMCGSDSRNVSEEVRNAAFRGDEGEEEEEEDDAEEVELSLGLSLGGRFGVDKTAKENKLVRSSSIIGTMPFARRGDGDDLVSPVPAVAYPALMRTSSLPTETEEEWRKRKKLQTLRRMAAKRRRSEKQRISGAGAKEEEHGLAPLRQASGGLELLAPARCRQPNSQGSVESQGGSSSGMSELESRAAQGSSSYGEERSQEIVGPPGAKPAENKCSTSGSKPEMTGGNKGREIGTNAMEDMPCVFTKGDGPNGRRVDGILYRYGKGEDVRIMCVCHGKFLSPAEFVKHAGGGDVDHPLRHIMRLICSSTCSYFWRSSLHLFFNPFSRIVHNGNKQVYPKNEMYTRRSGRWSYDELKPRGYGAIFGIAFIVSRRRIYQIH